MELTVWTSEAVGLLSVVLVAFMNLKKSFMIKMSKGLVCFKWLILLLWGLGIGLNIISAILCYGFSHMPPFRELWLLGMLFLCIFSYVVLVYFILYMNEGLDSSTKKLLDED